MKTIIVSCEHACYSLPKEYQNLYTTKFLQSHRGYDRGALTAFTHIKTKLDLWGIHGQYSRLLIDLNRSINSNDVFSIQSDRLNNESKLSIIEQVYTPYRRTIETKIDKLVNQGNHVIHLSLHSFTPVLRTVRRITDIGLLFDPQRENEVEICTMLLENLVKNPRLQVDFNKPYAGTDDGLTTYLRTRFKDQAYSGIEIEFNQKIIKQTIFKKILDQLCLALQPIASY